MRSDRAASPVKQRVGQRLEANTTLRGRLVLEAQGPCRFVDVADEAAIDPGFTLTNVPREVLLTAMPALAGGRFLINAVAEIDTLAQSEASTEKLAPLQVARARITVDIGYGLHALVELQEADGRLHAVAGFESVERNALRVDAVGLAHRALERLASDALFHLAERLSALFYEIPPHLNRFRELAQNVPVGAARDLWSSEALKPLELPLIEYRDRHASELRTELEQVLIDLQREAP